MATIAAAMASAHAPGVTGWFEKADPAVQRTVGDAYRTLGEVIASAQLDALVIVANDHIENYPPHDYPDFAVGVGERQTGPDEWFKPWLNVPDYDLPGAPDVARTIYERLAEGDLRVVSNDALKFDDNISVPVTMTGLTGLQVPLVPLIQNCTVPPVPDHRASYAFGQRLGRIIREELPAGLRIGLYGSGGLSHEPGGPKYLSIDEEFDRWFLDLLAKGDHDRILREATYERMEAAGAGGTAELLSWLVVMGAIGERDCDVLCYEAVPDWRCGVGAVRWAMAEAA
jgi:aromatic ring-opening dioxygenase catalytic subunit (LigB family)